MLADADAKQDVDIDDVEAVHRLAGRRSMQMQKLTQTLKRFRRAAD